MNKSILDHKIPTHIGLVFLCIILGLTIFLLSGKSFLSLRASPAKTPTIVRIANISTTSFTVSFSTASESIGQVSYGESKNPEVLVKDDREREINEKPHRLHYFTINNLKPNTEYFFNLSNASQAAVSPIAMISLVRMKSSALISLSSGRIRTSRSVNVAI